MKMLEVKTVQGPGGDWYLHVPEGYLACLVPVSEADGVWRECAAVRMVADGDGSVALFEVASDLEALTAPEADLGA